MSDRGPQDLIEDIREAAQRTKTYCENISYEDFIQDTKTQDAVIRNIEIIGEAAKLLPDEYREKYSSIPWKNIAGMRDKLIHHYFGINLDIVWDVVSKDLASLLIELQQ